MAYPQQMTHTPNMTDQTVNSSITTFFNGHVAHGSDSYDPYVSGYAFLKWITLPQWIDNKFAQLTERNFKGLSGLNDMQMDTGTITAGFTKNELAHAQGTVQKAEGFTLKYQNQSGAPIDRMYNHWVSGIRDPKTGIATYPKLSGLPYHSRNHTATLLYVVTRPDADNFGAGSGEKSNIEFAALWTNVMPTKIILNPYNFEQGDHSFNDNEQEFKGYLNIGQAVEEFAAAQMSAANNYTIDTENNFMDMAKFTSKGVTAS